MFAGLFEPMYGLDANAIQRIFTGVHPQNGASSRQKNGELRIAMMVSLDRPKKAQIADIFGHNPDRTWNP